MKYTLTITSLMLATALLMGSCKKSYYCHCTHNLVVDGTDTVKNKKNDVTVHEVREIREDAEKECRYYETEEEHLGRPAIGYHDCELKETDKVEEEEVVEE